MELVYRLSRLPVSVYTKDWVLQSSFGTGEKNKAAYDRQMFQKLQQRLEEKETDQAFLPYHEQVPIGLYGCRRGGRIYILGPFCYGPLQTLEAGRFLRRNRLEEYPACRMEDARNVVWFLLHSGKAAAGREAEATAENGREEKAVLCGVTDQESMAEEVWQMEAFQQNHTYQEEEKLYNCIREGDVDYLKEHIDDIALPHPIILEDVKKNEEYMMVTGISLAARAAIEGGISSKEAFLYNDLFLKRIAACRDIQAMHVVQSECYLQFARIVRDRKRKESALNRHVEECKRAIVTRRFERISIDELAADVGVSKEYLQKLFKQYEGIPITEYITDKKLEAACSMLRGRQRDRRSSAFWQRQPFQPCVQAEKGAVADSVPEEAAADTLLTGFTGCVLSATFFILHPVLLKNILICKNITVSIGYIIDSEKREQTRQRK